MTRYVNVRVAILALVFLHVVLFTGAQTLISFNAYTGSYSMKDLKYVQGKIASKAGGTVEKNFPAKFGYQLEVTFRSSENRFGFYGDYAGTKSTIGSSESMTATRHAFGFVDYLDIGARFAIGFRLAFCRTIVNTSGVLYTLGSLPPIQDPSFSSSGVLLEPTISYTIPTHAGDFRIALGYELNHQGSSHYTKNTDLFFVTEGTERTPNWSGIRLNLSYGIHVGNKWNSK